LTKIKNRKKRKVPNKFYSYIPKSKKQKQITSNKFKINLKARKRREGRREKNEKKAAENKLESKTAEKPPGIFRPSDLIFFWRRI
jgi:hypothetical protein